MVSTIGIWISARTAGRIHTEKLAFDREQAERRFVRDVAVAEARIKADAALAEKRFLFDNKFAATKRLIELVEPTLTDFYSACDAIQYARFPGAFGGEGATRPRTDGETDDQAGHLNTLYVPVERVQKSSALFSRIFVNRYRFQANFGQTAAAPFIILKEIQGEIYGATFGLINEARRGRARILRDNWESTIWEGPDDQDPVKPKLKEMIVKIEAICKPILQQAEGV